jgi:hypothetical protein
MNSKMKNSLRLGSIIFAWIPLTMAAQTTPEQRNDKKSITVDAHRVADDRRDVDRLSDLVMRWDNLKKSEPKSAALKQVEDQIFSELRRDLKESTLKTQQAKSEVAQSKAEVRQSQKEKRREKWDRDHDRRAMRDDKKDLRDDVQDVKKTEDLLNRKRSTAKELVALQMQIDTPGKVGDKVLQQKQNALLEEYLKLSQEEIRLGVREMAEDRRELYEDRRR